MVHEKKTENKNNRGESFSMTHWLIKLFLFYKCHLGQVMERKCLKTYISRFGCSTSIMIWQSIVSNKINSMLCQKVVFQYPRCMGNDFVIPKRKKEIVKNDLFIYWKLASMHILKWKKKMPNSFFSTKILVIFTFINPFAMLNCFASQLMIHHCFPLFHQKKKTNEYKKDLEKKKRRRRETLIIF